MVLQLAENHLALKNGEFSIGITCYFLGTKRKLGKEGE